MSMLWLLQQMARTFRIFAREGYAERISGHISLHISVRDPDFEDRNWINPLGVHFEMLKASDMICVGIPGDVVDENTAGSVNTAGFQIHGAYYKSRKDLHAVPFALVIRTSMVVEQGPLNDTLVG
ncbi:hypothetical protein F1880_000199 [Penicillium rolfsii]|nr:hypothetical protein F1880_000199 [Penicillium rolfsii]